MPRGLGLECLYRVAPSFLLADIVFSSRDTPKYNGSVKAEDWLVDYVTAVGIAGGRRRVAVRYAPLMLQGSARSWLNSLPSNSINCWKDFDDAFVCNFIHTYERPGLPRHLALCVQGKDEPLRDYL